MKFLKEYASFTSIVIDAWQLDYPNGDFLRVPLERIERHFRSESKVFCTQCQQRDWHQRLESGVHTDAMMGRIIYNTIWVVTGGQNMRETIDASQK